MPPSSTIQPRSSSVQHPATKKYSLSTLRVIVAAAAPVSAELTTQLVEAFPKLQIGQGYGQCFIKFCAARVLIHLV